MNFPAETLVFGHRGASAAAPQNTLPAFELAAAMGADGIEFDVHLSADGVPVIIHDFTVEATSSGHGTVAEMTLAELKVLDAGAWFDPKFAGTPVPTLDEVFAAVGSRLLMNIEIKAATAGIEQAVAALIRQYQFETRVLVSSFDVDILRRFRGVMPDVPVGFLFVPVDGINPLDVAAELQAEALHPYHLFITPPFIPVAAAAGCRVNAWTVNDPARAVELRDMGVNVIISDHPDVILAAVRAQADA